ncbi:hypothetical protein [Paenibacillus cymbidii]|uniref:hypothetical protein n=1 Tax=Paenibacillus cymbidii TaxID=1639034 RepID=UPI00108015E5|nr:hypothetical protein [Paenibacillus cymbidii]
MSQQLMYPAIVNSPVTELAVAINDTATSFSVANGAALPAAPNLATIGTGENAETILYTGKTGNALSGVTRGFQGTAQSWPLGAKVARRFTAYDYSAFKANIEDIAQAANTQSATLRHGGNVITADQGGPLLPTINGRTQPNIFGNDGNCESLTPFTEGGTGGTSSLSTTQKRNGAHSIKFDTSTNSRIRFRNYSYTLDAAKYYLLCAWVFVESYTNGDLRVSLRDSSGGTTRYIASVNTSIIGQWQLVYVKIPTSNTLVGNGFVLAFGHWTDNSAAVSYFDDIRFYEVSAADYAAIGTTITATSTPSIDEVWPYVDGVKHVANPMLVKYGKNLLPPFTDWTNSTLAVINTPYSVTLNATATNNSCDIRLTVLPGQSYTISGTVPSGARIRIGKNDNASPLVTTFIEELTSANSSKTFTIPAGTTSIVVAIHATTAPGSYTFVNLQLELGSTKTEFAQRNDDYIYTSGITLAGSIDGTVRDSIYWRDGAWRAFRRWKTGVVLDGSLAMTYWSNNTGIKVLKYMNFTGAKYDDLAYVEKFNGQPLTYTPLSVASITAGDFFRWGTSDSYYMSVSNSESGWVDAIIPNANSIKALLNGWQANGNNGTVYNSWVSILDGVTAPGTNTEAFVAANKAPNWTGWGTLSYQLAAPLDEVLPAGAVEGSISLHPGGNYIEVGEGVIVREIVSPYETSTQFRINHKDDPQSSWLKRRVDRALKIYKNGVEDNTWSIFRNASFANGMEHLYISKSGYDATAQYTVTYIMLDKYAMTAAVDNVAVTYNTNIKTVLDAVVQQQADIATKVSVHDWLLTLDGAYITNLQIDVAALKKRDRDMASMLTQGGMM